MKNKGLLTIITLLTTFGSILSFPVFARGAHFDEPTIITGNATGVDSGSAVLNGFVDGNGFSTRVWFEYGRDTNFAISTLKSSIGSGSGNFEKKISKLNPNTVYYFRAVAQNSEGTNYGSTLSFRTSPIVNYFPRINYPIYYNYYDPINYPDYYYDYNYDNYYTYPNYYSRATGSDSPTALTNAATYVGSTSVQLNSLILTSINNPSNAWFEWGTTPSLGNSTNAISVGALPAIKHINTLTGLNPGTVYYFRAVAENSYWRNNGSILSFVTSGSSARQSVSAPAAETPAQTSEVPAPAKTDTAPAKTDTATSNLGASVAGITSFFPGTIIGWALLIIFVLLLLLLAKHLYQNQPADHKHSAEHSGE